MLAENSAKIPLKANWFSFFLFSPSMRPSVLKLEINQHYGFITKHVAFLHNTQANLSFKISDICLKLVLTF